MFVMTDYTHLNSQRQQQQQQQQQDKISMENRREDDLKSNNILPVEGMSFISVNAGNSQIKWSFHKPSDWLPYLFWDTCHIQPHDSRSKVQATEPGENNQMEPIVGNLVEYLPPIVCNYIFGKDQSFTYESARRNLLSEAAKVKVSASTSTNITTDSTSHTTELLRVYIVSSSLEQTKLLQEQWPRTCPCIVHVLPNSFFGMSPQLHSLPYYEGMGTDRTAATTGARHLYGLPTLVFDAGTALTYTALDVDGNIIGGGIVPGIQLALTTLHQATSGRLPHISIVEEQHHDLQCNIFETNTKDAIISATLEQTLSYIRRIIAGWLHLVGDSPNNHSRETKEGTTQTVAEYVSSIISGDRATSKLNDGRCVVFTGGDGMLLHKLLSRTMTSTATSMPNMGLTALCHDRRRELKVTTSSDSAYLDLLELNNDLMSRCSMAYNGHLIHVGITHALLQQSTSRNHKLIISNMPTRDELSKTLEGARVAKKMNHHKNTKYLLGTVLGLYEIVEELETPQSSSNVIVSYLDGSRDIVNLEELSELLQNFIRIHGNGKSVMKRADSSEQQSGKRKSRKVSPAVPDVITTTTEGKGGSAKELLASPNSKSIKTNNNHDSFSEMKAFVGQRISKYFDGDIYSGSVTEALPDDEAECGFYFHVKYDDGDSEDLDKSELMDGLELYRKKKIEKHLNTSTSTNGNTPIKNSPSLG